MDLLTILAFLRAGGEVAEYVVGLANRLKAENREPTQAEIDDVKSRQGEADAAWAALAPK